MLKGGGTQAADVATFRAAVKRPGGHQVRAVIRQDRSERVGSGAQFVEVPQVGKGRVALSGVILTDVAAADRPLALTFAPGSVVEYTCTVYDGRTDRAAGFSTTATVLRDGKPVYTSPPAPIAGWAAGAAEVAPSGDAMGGLRGAVADRRTVVGPVTAEREHLARGAA